MTCWKYRNTNLEISMNFLIRWKFLLLKINSKYNVKTKLSNRDLDNTINKLKTTMSLKMIKLTYANSFFLIFAFSYTKRRLIWRILKLEKAVITVPAHIGSWMTFLASSKRKNKNPKKKARKSEFTLNFKPSKIICKKLKLKLPHFKINRLIE